MTKARQVVRRAVLVKGNPIPSVSGHDGLKKRECHERERDQGKCRLASREKGACRISERTSSSKFPQRKKGGESPPKRIAPSLEKGQESDLEENSAWKILFQGGVLTEEKDN